MKIAEEFIEKWGAIFSEPNDFASDLDELLKERAEKAWIAQSYEYLRIMRKEQPLYKSFDNWYDTFIKEQ